MEAGPDILARNLGFPEGPVLCPEGSVIVTEIRHGALTRVWPDGSTNRLLSCGGGPNGLAWGPDGALYVCNNGGNRYEDGNPSGIGPHPDYRHGSIQRVDLTTGEVRTLYTAAAGHRLSAPNDLVFDRQGGFYFTDHGKRFARHRDLGGVFYALPDGSSVTEVAFPVFSANGCALSPDERTLYVADTIGARLLAFAIEAPGRLAPPPRFTPHSGRVIAGLPGEATFDSMAVLADGNIAVATLVTGRITEFTPGGSVVREVAMPDRLPTNLWLRRRRHAHGLHHPGGERPAGDDAVADAGPGAQLPTDC